MYTEFFGFKLKPFSITPDPKFLYMSPGHKEALAHLIYGIREHSGFVVITGEVGTGKTTILNAFIMQLPPRIPKVVIKNPNIRSENLYFLLGEAIGLPLEKRTVDNLHDYEERLKEIGGVVLIVDEAQGLSLEMLEEIRLLSNLETPHEKLMQILLLGQQELNIKLKNPKLRQLKQRISIKYNIPPLDSNGTKNYIEHRLRVAGYEPREQPVFTPAAIGEIFRKTKGYPRLINVICDNALLAAYTDDIKQVTPKIVKVVFTDMEKSYGKDRALDKAVRPNYAPKRYRFLKNIVFVFILCLVGVLLAWSIFTRYTSAQISSGDSPILQLESGCDDPSENKNTFEQQHSKHAPPSNRAKIALEDVDSNHQTSPIPPPAANSGKPSGIWVKVSNGDTLAALTAEYYGMIDPHIMQAVRDANSALEDINLIYEGQQIFLPNVNLPSRVLYSVSVASYHSIDEAQAVFTDLMGTKYEAAIYPYVDAQGKRWYRITIGTFLLKEEADEYALHLKQKGFLYARPLKISMEE